MIISASRRTDIPACYSSWFFNRLREGYALVPNPYNPKAVSRISLDPAVVDCIVFWTKNPAPMISRLDELRDYPYYFQFTLNPYGAEVETHLPPLAERIATFKRLSDKAGKERVVWRYDPIFTSDRYDVDFHREAFAAMAYELRDHTGKCMLGFIDHYRHIRGAVSRQRIEPLRQDEIERIAAAFRQSIDPYPICLETCTVKVDLSRRGIPCGTCIDRELVERIAGYPISAKRDRNQRDICRCAESIDIGTYGSCLNGCIYCYANKGGRRAAERNCCVHDPFSPLLLGSTGGDMTVTERKMRSLRAGSDTLF